MTVYDSSGRNFHTMPLISSADWELIAALLSNLDAAIIECVGGEQDSAVAVAAALSLGPSSSRASVVCDFGSGPTILMTTRTHPLFICFRLSNEQHLS